MIRSFVRLLTVASCLAALLVFAPSAMAKVYNVNTTSDHTPNGCSGRPGHDCTLREAILSANVRAGTDKIVLKHGKTYKRALNGTVEDMGVNGDLDISNSALVITSDSHRKAIIDGGHSLAFERVFDVFSSAKFVDVKITHGTEPSTSVGAGIRFTGGSTLTLLRTAVTSNKTLAGGGGGFAGAGVYVSTGKTTITRGVISGNDGTTDAGGGIAVRAPTTISKTTVSGNSADEGGGVFVDGGSFKAVASTISGNHAAGAAGRGGGLSVFDKAGLYNSTIDGNTAEEDGGGIYLYPGAGNSVGMNAVTLAHNKADFDHDNNGDGGGIYTNGGGNAFSAKNSIIALNTAFANPDCDSGVAASGGQNLLTHNAGCPDFSSANGDFVNVGAGAMHLGALASNGGPTKTDALFRHSRALNRAGSDAPKRDQRGVLRHNPDIGAYER